MVGRGRGLDRVGSGGGRSGGYRRDLAAVLTVHYSL